MVVVVGVVDVVVVVGVTAGFDAGSFIVEVGKIAIKFKKSAFFTF